MFNRKGPHNEADGCYSQLLNANKTSINPGDVIEINEFISGYGKIEAAKIMYSISAKILDSKPNESFLLHGIKLLSYEETTEAKKVEVAKILKIERKDLTAEIFKKKGVFVFSWGAEKASIDNDSKIISLTAGISIKDSMPHLFFDSDFTPNKMRNPMITTESVFNGFSPLHWNLKISKKTKPGNYQISFILTYFNGTSYVNDHKYINIKVLHWYEKYEKKLKVLALVIAFLSITSTSLNIIDKYFKYTKDDINKNELHKIQKSNNIESKIDTLTKKINNKNDSIQ